MAEVNVLDKNSIIEGDRVIVTRLTEEKLSLQDLYQSKQNLQHQKQGTLQQMNQLNKRFSDLEAQEKEIDELITMLEPSV